MEAINYRNAIEELFQVIRNNNGAVTNYGLMGKYTYQNNWHDTAFSVGIVSKDIIKVEGIELVLTFPDVNKTCPVADSIFSISTWSLSVIIRDDVSMLNARNAILLLERSGLFSGFRYTFQDANPKVGNFPQYYCQWNDWIFRDIIIN